jgi:hypothetical protein
VPTVAVLWVCIGLFFARVVGQVEVLLVEPTWLPPMSAWYSGLLPYPLLLPLQIALLMAMSVLALRASSYSGSGRKVWRTLALLYFAVMAVRLVLCVSAYGSEFYLHGAIPIALHWVLALFALVYVRRPTPGWPIPAGYPAR